MLGDALVTVNASLLHEITDMSPEQIQMNGVVTLARLQGQLKHERALIDLSIVQPNPFGAPPEETYPDPLEEAREAEETTTAQSGSSSVAFQPFSEPLFTPEPPKAKRKYRKRKKRKQ